MKIKRVWCGALILLVAAAMNGKAQPNPDARQVLVELGDILKKMAKDTIACHELQTIKAWQIKKLHDLDSPAKKLHIATPQDLSTVPERPFIAGTIDDANSSVWVIVHPMGDRNYWVQPNVSVKEDLTWNAQIYIGRPGTIDLDKHFEIMAIANPETALHEGIKLDGWPKGQWKSQVIEVIRK